MIDNPADFYLDFQRFSALKLDARNGDEAAATTVARQFEGLFVQQMLTAMRAAAQIDPDQHNAYIDFYHEMHDRQLAQSIASEDKLGVARMILQQINRVDGKAEAADAPPVIAIGAGSAISAKSAEEAVAVSPAVAAMLAAQPPARPSAEQARAGVGQAGVGQAGVGQAGVGQAGVGQAGVGQAGVGPVDSRSDQAGVRLGRVVADDFAELALASAGVGPKTEPQQFVAGVWPAARAAADRLGVSPRLLVAQAALESGWGQHTMKFDDGRDSFNLFGIKAGADWRGGVISRASLEFEDGALQPRVSNFRAYESPRQSFNDYADFITSRPWYADALAVANDDRAYIRAVHEAGYATDPDYADKVIGIMDGDLLRQGLAKLDDRERANA